MKRRFQTYILQDSHMPLSTLAGGGLLIMASSRVAFALVALAALLWVYGLTGLTAFLAKPILPQQGRRVILLFVSSFLGSLFLLVLWLLSPLLALGSAYLIILSPVCCMGSELFVNLESKTLEEALLKTVFEAASLGGLILAFALIREPLGFMTISLPGGDQGIAELFKGDEGNSFFPVRILASSGGGLLLLGYGAALFRNLKKNPAGNPPPKEAS